MSNDEMEKTNINLKKFPNKKMAIKFDIKKFEDEIKKKTKIYLK